LIIHKRRPDSSTITLKEKDYYSYKKAHLEQKKIAKTPPLKPTGFTIQVETGRRKITHSETK